MSDSASREEALFSGALQLPASQRAGYLAGACGEDNALRQRVELLLRAYHKAGSFLEGEVAVARPIAEAVNSERPGGTVRIEISSTEKAGDRIGRYRLLQQIGEGGCGVVYMAEQQEPVKRRVALKVIKLGMDTKQVIARFEAERQALALMDHPNIAKVLDAGTSEAGRPFFVMELVRGIKITDYCDQNNLLTRQRLDLFIQVCHAIQHAHQKGVIHRDIKPSNILVTMHDGVPEPKVIDFGIAKATDQRLTDKTLFTAFEQFMGTPAYMSPEQAEMSALDIDTRSDIYSLGVLLYELLTGKTPFDPKELVQSGLDAMRRTIREKEPARPSTKLSSMMQADLMAAANHRQSEPDKLTRMLRGDLDWIVMKALEKDRTRRYETANGLAMDVRRYLQDEPVVARPPSRLYQFQKLGRRNKGLFAAALVVLLALSLGLAISTLLLARERKERRRAELAEKAATTAASESQHLAGFLQEMLQGVGPEVAQGKDTQMLRTILDETAEKVGSELKDEPEVEAKLRATMGQTYYDLGDYAKAEAMQRQSLALNRKLFGDVSTNSDALLRALASTLGDEEKLAESEAAHRQALAGERQLFGDTNPALVNTLDDLGLVLWLRGDLAQAEDSINQALSIGRNLPVPDPADEVDSLNNLGLVQSERGNFAGAEKNLQAALEVGKKPGAPAAANKGMLNGVLNNLAMTYMYEGKLTEAETMYRELLENLKKLLPPTHPHLALVRSHLATMERRRGALLSDLASLHESLRLNPEDPFTADALACVFAKPALFPLMTNDPAAWHYTNAWPGDGWSSLDFSSAGWNAGPAQTGNPNYSPRDDRAAAYHTNLWLRQDFDLRAIPAGKLVLRLNRNQDAEVFLNGVQITPAIDWTDSERLMPCSAAAGPALRIGRNVLAVHCQDVDAGALVDAALYVASDSSLGRKELVREFDSMIQQDPANAAVYAGRANAEARLGWWQKAAADLAKAIELKPGVERYWSQLGPLYLQMGDLPGYEFHRQRALAKFGDPDGPTVGEPVAKLCLLLPANGPDLQPAMKLAESASGPGYALSTLARRQWTEGLAEFRQGRFASAIEWMRKAQATCVRPELPAWDHERERNLNTGGYLVEALAYQELNQTVEAQVALAKGAELFHTQLPQTDSGDIGREWPDWLIVQILLREAQSGVKEKIDVDHP